jgi:DNA uptake protein ComE-like DNA-binding protein
MRMMVFAAAIASAAVTLMACSSGNQSSGNASAEGATGEPVTNAGSSAQSAGDATARAGAVLNANTASAAQLAGASGVSPEVAQAIVAGRPYATVVDLKAELRETLSEEQAAAVLTSVFVPVNLNSARREEIELIPGMSSRMVGEFLEYRPYEDLNEFNREIGKYVDEAEVTRLRSYVTL